MKNMYFLLFTITFLFACKGPEKITQKEEKDVPQIEVLLLAQECSDKDPLSLFKFNGIGFTKLKTIDNIGKDSFLLTYPEGDPQFLYVGTETQAKLPVILSNEKIQISGNCKAFRSSKISNSTYNASYNEMLKVIRANKRSLQSKLGQYRKAGRDANMKAQITKELAMLDQKHMEYLESVKTQNPFLANVVGLGTMMSFPNNADKYRDEVTFFANEFFKNVDLKNPVLNRIPYVFESFKEYAETLASTNMPASMVKDLIDQNLSMVPDSTNAMRYALGGALIGLQSKNHPQFASYAKLFIEKFGATTDEASVDRLESQLGQAKSFITGGEAPEINMKNPEGEEISLSKLKGNVVLIDFWASWCGPCRRENPNVVKVYNKYNDKGFEILGVSLDRTKNKWEAAIAKDGLTWLHVSDLKGWQNKAAQTYGVRSIPHTVLVDREGKIIARNLRGPALERKLAEIFE